MTSCPGSKRRIRADSLELSQVTLLVNDGDREAIAEIQADESADRRAGSAAIQVESACGINQLDQGALPMKKGLEHAGPSARSRSVHPGCRQLAATGRYAAGKPPAHEARAPIGIVGWKQGLSVVQRRPNSLHVAVVGQAKMLEDLARPPATLGGRPIELPTLERADQLPDLPAHPAEIGEPLRPLH
jgi:hypothetical protein